MFGVGGRISLENMLNGWRRKHTREKEKMGRTQSFYMEDCNGTRRMLKKAQPGQKSLAVGLNQLVSNS
jgi:hypothetical protein